MSTYSDLHSQQSLARVFSINGELNRQRCRNPSGVEAGSAGTHFTGIVCGKHLHLVGADRGWEEKLEAWRQTDKKHKPRLLDVVDVCFSVLPAWYLLVSVQYINGIWSLSSGNIVDCVSLVTVIYHLHRLHHTYTHTCTHMQKEVQHCNSCLVFIFISVH